MLSIMLYFQCNLKSLNCSRSLIIFGRALKGRPEVRGGCGTAREWSASLDSAMQEGEQAREYF
jgi:hypothetical protein